MKKLVYLLFAASVLRATVIREIPHGASIPWFVQTNVDGKVTNFRGEEINQLLNGAAPLKSKGLGVKCKLTFAKVPSKGQKNLEQMWLDCDHNGVVFSGDAVSCTSSTSQQKSTYDKKMFFAGKKRSKDSLNIWIFCGRWPTIDKDGTLSWNPEHASLN